jgi:hypothetical protein
MTANTEQQILSELRGLKEMILETNTKLFGSRDGEEGEGRLPIAERRLNDHSHRIGALERKLWMVIGGATVVVSIIEVATRFWK